MSFTWPLGKAESQLEFYDLSHPWGLGVPAWPYFEDVKIERLHGMAKSRVLTQKITTVMHSGTHIDVEVSDVVDKSFASFASLNIARAMTSRIAIRRAK